MAPLSSDSTGLVGPLHDQGFPSLFCVVLAQLAGVSGMPGAGLGRQSIGVETPLSTPCFPAFLGLSHDKTSTRQPQLVVEFALLQVTNPPRSIMSAGFCFSGSWRVGRGQFSMSSCDQKDVDPRSLGWVLSAESTFYYDYFLYK